MVRFIHDGVEFTLCFEYGKGMATAGVKPEGVMGREALKLSLTYAGLELGTVVVVRYYKDQHSWEEARRAAIKKVSKECMLSRPLRTALWQAYLNSDVCKRGYKGSRVA